ncbi:DUF6545 domain-containing protein [Nocardia sp. NPDC050712]|uniref:DUF6545 domain-containing protein n=1 Tax=Nocardia sp. NPDC050712 TaxID=3155518 RepID=UPI00340CDFEF
MTALSAPISALLVGLSAAILLGRWWLVRDQFIDRLLNWALSWEALGMLCFAGLAGVVGFELAQYLFLASGPLAIANVYGVARLLDGADPVAAAARQPRYNWFGAGASLGIAGAAVAGYTRVSEWVWAASNVAAIAAGPLIIRACVRELRTVSTWRERLTYSALLLVGMYLAVGSATVAVRAALGLPTAVGGLLFAIVGYSVLVVLCLLIAIPLVLAVLKRVGLDRDSRRSRRLRPLWLDLTAAVPEVVLARDASYRDAPDLRLYRMTVEIRDALLQLKGSALEELPDPATDIDGYALRVAEAARAKSLGAPAHRAWDTAPPAAPPDRAAELRALFELAAAWPRAKAATGVAQRC